MKNLKKIGVFDSGLGGLFIAESVRKRLPAYDYVYLGDTLHLPYGRRSDAAIYDLSEKAMRYLFDCGCDLIVMACNTASAAALRKLQQGFLARDYPDKRILGVIVPTLEAAIDHGATKIGLLATERTIESDIYKYELTKINPNLSLVPVSAPLLVPLIEHHGDKYLDAVVRDYLEPMLAAKVETVILGCTHYVALKDRVLALGVDVISQDDIIPEKLADYLTRHPEMDERLSRGGTFSVHITDVSPSFLRHIEDRNEYSSNIVHARY